MNSAAKTSTVRMFVAVAALVTAVLGLLGAVVRLLGVLVTSATMLLQRAVARAQRAKALQPVAPQAAHVPQQVAPQAFCGPQAYVPQAVYAPQQTASQAPCAAVAAVRSRPTFELPAVDHLAVETAPAQGVDKDKLQGNAAKLVKTLASYGVDGTVEDIVAGPTVTTYEFAPAVGTKVSKVAALADDIALSLGSRVRIVAPIPGKNRIGFELPNEHKAPPVALRGLIEDSRFQALDASLPVVLGRDTQGSPVYADLASMPHLIVSGATGSGKSVGLNVMLLSLLFRRSPEELRLIMVDPKVVELAPFNGIPHMLAPVVTDMKQAATALNWAVSEMERRYQLFAQAGTRNITSYNALVDRMARESNAAAPLPEKLPSIVIVVDEFADLMQQQGKEVESAVSRLAQKARASGMHVILATQRPSVDVITGVIKANFPSRVAYRVSQKVDSRIILDEQGAETLLGNGDMLVKLNGSSETQRVQCPWVSEDEVAAVTSFLRAQGEPVYDQSILAQAEVQPAKTRRPVLRVVA